MSRLVVAGILVGAAALFVGWQALSRSRESWAEPPAEPPAGRDQFAADRDAGFDAARAMKYLEDVCRIGARISDTDGMRRQQELLKKHFEKHGGQVRFQRFQVRQRSRQQPTEMTNLIVSWQPEKRRRVILCSHYDTRPIADQELDRRRWREEFVSANDGGSGVALLMELAHHMDRLNVGPGVDFVFFDGEEYIFDPSPTGDKYFFGSEHFAEVYRKERGKQGATEYLAAVLLDMVAGKGARFPVERNSWLQAGPLVRDLWGIAVEKGCPAFRGELGPEVLDDHLALNRVGIPAVDIIDFDYPHWHRLTDVPENCSGDPMGQVARVLITWLQRVR